MTKTDAKGSFELDVTKPGDHVIKATVPKMKFAPVTVSLTPSTEKLPALTPSEVEVCGRFVLASSLKSGVSCVYNNILLFYVFTISSLRVLVSLADGRSYLRSLNHPLCFR